MRDFFSGGKRRLWTFLLLAVFLLSLGVGIYEWTRPVEDPVRMTHETPAGSHAYLDICLLTEWVYKVTGDSSYTFYEAMDTEGDWYILSLSDSAYKELQPLVDAYYAVDENTTVEDLPEPVRLGGVARFIASDDIRSMASSYRVSASDYTAFYGPRYLDEGNKPASSLGMAAGFAAFFFGLMLLIFVTQALTQRRNLRKSDDRLYTLGLAGDAEAEFAAPENLRFEKAKLVLSEHFLYAASPCISVPYEDVLWLYQREQRTYGILVGTYLMAGLADGRMLTLAMQNRKEPFIDTAVQVIAGRNPSVLVGYTGDNQREFRRLVKEYKQSR